MNLLTIKAVNRMQWLILIGIVLGKYFEVAALVIFIMSLLFFFKEKIYLSRGIIIAFLILFIYTFISIYVLKYEYDKFIQQWGLLLFFFCSYYTFFIYNKNHLESLWTKYLQISYWISIIGLTQFIIYFFYQIDIFPNEFGTEGRVIKVHSFFQEAGNLGAFLCPAIATFFFDNNKYYANRKYKGIVIILAELLTFTTIAYFMLVLLLFVKFYSYKHLKYVLISIAIFFLMNIFTVNIKNESNVNGYFNMMQTKFLETFLYINNGTPYEYESLNSSSYATLTNLWVARNAPNRLFGTGLGTHEYSYTKLYKSNIWCYGLNKEDAYSLFSRIFSEFGYFGLIVLFLFLYKNRNFTNIINKSVFFIFIAYLIRGGNYTLYGTVFFYFLYINSSAKNIQAIKDI